LQPAGPSTNSPMSNVPVKVEKIVFSIRKKPRDGFIENVFVTT
jgi:hypothetical protein